MTRVAFVGANSIEFARVDVADLCRMPELERLELTLHDPDAGRLAHVVALARLIARQAGTGATVRGVADLGEALDGADYVLSELEVGGYEATRLDFEIPARYGLRQSVADTIGIGGIFRGLRTIPVAVGISREMSARCPDAHLLSYTNPMAMSCWAITETTPEVRLFGLCHSVDETHALLARLVGVDLAQVDFLTAGPNHQAFVLRFEHRGRSLYSRLAEVLERQPELCPPVALELFQRLGYFSTHCLAEYLPWFMRHDGERERLLVTVDGHEEDHAENLRQLAEQREQVEAGSLPGVGPAAALGARFIHAIETQAEIELYATVRNDGLVANLPSDCCVEVPCRLRGGAAVPVGIGALPRQLAALNRTFLNVVELTVHAVLDGDRRHAYHAALLDPNAAATLTAPAIAALCDELLEAHRGLLPAEEHGGCLTA